jgi:hypothetical protein
MVYANGVFSYAMGREKTTENGLNCHSQYALSKPQPHPLE